jgi:hypothetical protein
VESASATFSFEFDQQQLEDINFRRLDETKGQRGAVNPMEMEMMPLAQLPPKDQLPGRTIGEATSGDGKFPLIPLETGYSESGYKIVESSRDGSPAIAAAEGTDPAPVVEREATLAEKLPSEPGVRSFARVRFTDDETVEPVRTGGAGVLSSVAAADGWVVVPESREGIPAGETVTVRDWEYLA